MSPTASAVNPPAKPVSFSRQPKLALGASSLRRAALVAAVGVIAGCAPNQTKEIGQYRKVLDGDKPLAIPKVEPGQPLSLEEALLLANRNDETLAQNGENYLQALIDKDRAFSAFIPTITLAPTLTWIDKPGATGTGSIVTGGGTTGTGGTGTGTGGTGTGGTGTGTGGTTTGGTGTTGVFSTTGGRHSRLDVPLVGNVNVFNGFRDVDNVNRAAFTIEQRRALLLDLQMTLFLEVAQAYYAVLTAERSVVVLTNSAAVQDARVSDMQNKFAAGVARPLDVAQSAAQAAATRAQLVTARSNVRNTRTVLAYMVDAPVQNSPLIDRVLVPDKLEPVADYVGRGQVGRQDLVAARATVETQRQVLKEALGAYWPTLTLNVDYFLHKQTVPTLSEWDGILSLSLPIFSAGIIEANVRTSWSQLRQAELQARYVARTVNEQVLTAYENVDASSKRLVELRTEVRAAQDALRQAQQTYLAGLATNLDVLTAQDELLAAQLSLVSEELNFKIFYLDLLRTIGQLARPQQIPSDDAPPASQPSDLETFTPVPNSGQMAPPTLRPDIGPPSDAPTLPRETTQPQTNPTTGPATQPAAEPTTQPNVFPATVPATTQARLEP